jgi:RES domain-containing protein
MLIEVELPANINIFSIADWELPKAWDAGSDQNSTRDLGTKWANDQTTAIMSVPSVVIPKERNYLLNPAHQDFARIKFSAPEPFVFDARLKS